MMRKQSEQEIEANRASLARLGRLYKTLFSLPGLIALIVGCWIFGYVQGYWDGWNRAPSAFERTSRHDK